MPEVYRTDNPLQYTQLDGVIVTEKSPPPAVVSVGANNCIFVGQFERGPKNSPRFVTSISDLDVIFGENPVYSGTKALLNKRFSNLYVTRVVASDATKAKWTQTVSSSDLITFEAKEFGAYGNGITITIANGTATGKKNVTVSLGSIVESYNDVEFVGKSDAQLAEIFRESILVNVTSASADTAPSNVAAQKLATGIDGSVSATDYKLAIEASNVRVSGKIFFCDDQSNAVKAALTNFIKAEQNGQCVIGPEDLNTTVAAAITEFNTLKDNQGRVIYVYNPLSFNRLGVIEEESPVYMAASILNVTPPHLSPAAASTTNYTQTVVDTKFNLTRGNLVLLKNAGINAFENDQDLGVKLVTGDTGNPEFSILRRRMSDFYINSVARYLKFYQSLPNSLINRASIRSAITAFDTQLVSDGILPSDAEVDEGRAFEVKTEGITSDKEKAEGILKVEINRRLFAAAKFLVLVVTIAETVVIKEV